MRNCIAQVCGKIRKRDIGLPVVRASPVEDLEPGIVLTLVGDESLHTLLRAVSGGEVEKGVDVATRRGWACDFIVKRCTSREGGPKRAGVKRTVSDAAGNRTRLHRVCIEVCDPQNLGERGLEFDARGYTEARVSAQHGELRSNEDSFGVTLGGRFLRNRFEFGSNVRDGDVDQEWRRLNFFRGPLCSGAFYHRYSFEM